MDCATSVSPILSENTPRKVFLRKALQTQKKLFSKKICTLQQAKRRKDQQISQMQQIISELKKKNFVSCEELQVLDDLGKCNADLLKRQYCKSEKKTLPRQYSPELRRFAITLHYYSPRAYSYVRQKFDTCLPHPKTISKWYKSVNGKPGFNAEAFESISKHVKSVDYMLLGALMFDEMAIRQHIEFNGTKFCGYIDLGPDVETDNTSVAKDALVFLVNAINGCWKIPIGYFLIASLNAEQKQNLVLQALSQLHECGIKIISVTFDGAPTNLHMCKLLGCSFELQSFQTYFQHPVSADKVVVFLDACHDLKLVRNALADLKVLIDHDGNLIEWKYFLLLEELQRHEGLHLGNKLKNNHVNYRNQKMKVKLAAQLFSRSVADALQLCESDLKLPAFKHAAATIKFIQIINDLFDILNSKNIKQPGLKSAIHSANFATIQEVLNNGFDYIKKLQLTNGQLIVTSPRKTGFLGFLICISSIQYLYQSLCQDKTILLCIPAYKFSQDHLELLFGCIRYHGGCNNNPTARQLEIIFKKLLVHAEVKESATGNCVPFQNVNILHVSSNSEKIINITTPHAHMVDIADVESVITDHSYLPNMEITELSERIIVYIAGFVVRHLKKKILCEDCLDALISDNMFLHSSLISIKNRGKLIYPSKSVVTICRKCEVVIRRALRESGGKKLLKKFSPIYLLNMVLNNLLPSTSLFQELDDHCNNQTDYSNHCAHLIRATANKYITIRLYYIGSTVNQNNSERQKLNKLILFKGQ